MPIFFQKDIDKDTRLGIWQITEGEDFFLQQITPQRQVSHAHKRLQHLAGRYLLGYLFPDFPTSLIQIADTRKPFLENEVYHFSISHCGDFAAALVSKTKRVGVDIELTTPKIQKVKHKFLSDPELKLVHEQGAISNQQLIEQLPAINDLLILLWSCKEAVFKWYGTGELNFKEHIAVEKIKQTEEDIYQTTICFQKEKSELLQLHSCFLNVHSINEDASTTMALSYVVT